MMNHLIIAATVTVILGMVSGVPLVINKRDVTTITEQDFTSTSPHCSLPEATEEYSTFIFGYNVTDVTELDKIKEQVEGYTDNCTKVQSAVIVHNFKHIIFKMNRAAYLKACTNPAVKFVEYDKSEVIIQNNVCQNRTIAHGTPLSIDILTPTSLRKKQARCERLKKRLQKRTRNAKEMRANDDERFFTTAESCTTTEDGVKFVARFNKRSLQFMCNREGLHVAALQQPQIGLSG